MRLWPWLLDLTFGSPERERPVHLWLPLFLVWPLMVLVALLAFVVTLPVDTVLLLVGRPYHHYTALVYRTFALFSELRGMVVRVKDDETKTLIDMSVY